MSLPQECQIQPFFCSSRWAAGACVIWCGLFGCWSHHCPNPLLRSSDFPLGLIKESEFLQFSRAFMSHEPLLVCIRQGRLGEPVTRLQIFLVMALARAHVSLMGITAAPDAGWSVVALELKRLCQSCRSWNLNYTTCMTLSRGATREAVVQAHRAAPCEAISKQDKVSLWLLRAVSSGLTGSLSSFCAEEMYEGFSAPVHELSPLLQRFAVTVEKSWRGTGHVRNAHMQCHPHPALQHNDRGPVFSSPRTHSWHRQHGRSSNTLKIIERSSTLRLSAHLWGCIWPHKPLQGELGKSSRLRRTCLKPACRRPRRPVLTGVPQGRTRGWVEEQGWPSPTMANSRVLGRTCEHPVAGVQKMFPVSLCWMASIERVRLFSSAPRSPPPPPLQLNLPRAAGRYDGN